MSPHMSDDHKSMELNEKIIHGFIHYIYINIYVYKYNIYIYIYVDNKTYFNYIH